MTSLGRVSVCMATYNGESFVAEQLASVLSQLGPDDEVVVVDDCSTDATLEVVRSFADDRVVVVARSTNQGYVATFEQALTLATGEHVFLADQDDVWPDARVATMQRALQHAHVVAGNVGPLDPAGSVRPIGVAGKWRLEAAGAERPWRMVLRLAASQAPYYGSAMALHRAALSEVLPFPASARELHDAWIALVGLTGKSMTHVDDNVVLRRVHDANASGRPRSPWRIVVGRILFARMVVSAVRRTRARSGQHA